MCQMKLLAERLSCVARGTKPMSEAARDESAGQVSCSEGTCQENDLGGWPCKVSHQLPSITDGFAPAITM